MVKKRKRKIPRNAVAPLMHTCELLSDKWKRPASEIFKGFLELMNKYADYFFSKPWPKKYDFEEATTFTDEDVDFLSRGGDEEFSDRYTTMSLKKNMHLEHGFLGYFGMFWTQQAFREKFVRPRYRPVLEAFDSLAEDDEDARRVLNKLKEQYSIKLIHNSLVDLLEHEYPHKTRRRLVAKMLELLHEDEGLPPCDEYRCELTRKTSNENSDDEDPK